MVVSISDFEINNENLESISNIFSRYGVVVVRGLARDYVEAVSSDIKKALQRATELLPQATRSDLYAGGWTTPDGSMFNENPEGSGSFVINKLKLNAYSSGAFLASAINPRLLDVLEHIIGPNIEFWKWGHTIHRPPETNIPKSLHQDEFYFEHYSNSSVAVINYLDDVSLDHAPLVVAPGSHRLGLLEHNDDQWAGFVLPDDGWWNRVIPIEGRAGDAIIIHGLVVHGSLPNRSPTGRSVCIHRYRRAGDYCMVQADNLEQRKARFLDRSVRQPDDRWPIARGLRV